MNMTSFDITGGNKQPEEWARIAFKRTAEDGLQFQVIFGLVAAGIAAIAVSPPTGLLVAGWTIWDSIQKVKQAGRNQLAIRDYGCVAPFLGDDEFVAYARQVRLEYGDERLQAELQFAVENGFDIGDAAFDYLEKTAGNRLRVAENPLPLLPVKSPAATATQTQADTYKRDNSINIVEQMTARIGNCLIIGTPGSGKGMLLANAIRAAKAKYPDLKVFVIDPKASEQEAGYFKGAADVVKLFKCETAEPKEVVDWLEQCFKEYYQYWEEHRRVLLVLDEGTLVGSKAKSAKSDIVKNTVVSLASAGDGEGRNIWITSLSPYVGDLGINLNASSQLIAYAILTKNNLGSLKQWGKSSILEKITVEELAKLVDESPCDRAIFSGVSSKWYSMPALYNYSAFDRDNRKPVGDALTTEQRQLLRDKIKSPFGFGSSESAETAKTPTASPTEIMIDKLERTRCKTLEDFIIQELGEGDRLEELTEAIISTIRDTNHWGLKHKFKLD